MDIQKKPVKKAALLFLLSLFVFSVWGQEKKNISTGLLVEANANTRHGYGLAGGITGDYGITDNFALGIKGDYGTDFYDVSSVEALAFGRYYFLNTPFSFPFFLQAGAGLSMLLEGDKSVSTVLGEGGLGIRFPIKKFYTEQYLRFGWPFGFGFGIVFGYRFDLKSSRPDIREQQHEGGPAIPDPVLPEPVLYELPEEPEEPEPVEEPEPPELESLTRMEIFFVADMADFESLLETRLKTFEDNTKALNAIASFLKAHGDYSLTITGHANPVEKTAAEEEASLRPLSLQRAEYVKARLVDLGINPGRISATGAGGREADPQNAVRNRRVDFSFARKPPAAPGG
jgi:outer membrane protein OmpA-like peptidoglycan-associated protein